jgi:hypothetical protein
LLIAVSRRAALDVVKSLHQHTQMPKIKEFTRFRIAIYPRDHLPPHVHVEFRDGDRCTVEIASLKILGTVRPAAKLTDALDWIAANRVPLLAKWKEIVR